MVNPYEHTKEIINTVKNKTNRVLVFYSGGKDSIAMLDMVAKNFEEVVCVFMYFVKGLEHTERYIGFSEKRYKNIKFLKKPHWGLTKIHSVGMYCKPQKIRQLSLKDIVKVAKLETGIDYVFIGEKKNDSLQRRVKLGTYEMGAISPTNIVYPLSEWSDKDVLRYIERNKLPKPVSYSGKRQNGVMFDLGVFLYLRENYPNDLKKILEAYPLSGKILFDYDQKIQRERKKASLAE